MKEILEFSRVGYSWNRHREPLFSNLDFSVPAGTATALLGPNGAGKTTIMDLSLGWRQPDAGRVLLNGKALSSWNSRRQGRFMALVPQDESIHFDYTVLEYILLGRAPYLPVLGKPGPEDRQIARDTLEEIGIGHLMNRKVSRLSGGERQLVLLARSLVQQPRLLLLDEPASHLDLHNREKILTILEELLRKGISLFFTSHDPEMVLRLSGHVILLRDGRVIQSGNSETVLTEDSLSELYDVRVRIGTLDNRKVLLWGGPNGKERA